MAKSCLRHCMLTKAPDSGMVAASASMAAVISACTSLAGSTVAPLGNWSVPVPASASSSQPCTKGGPQWKSIVGSPR